MALRSHLIAGEWDFPWDVVDTYFIYHLPSQGIKPCATLRLIHGHVGVFTVFVFLFFLMWEKTFAVSVSICWRSFFVIPDCVLYKGDKTSKEEGDDLFQVLPQGYSDNKILPAVLKSFSTPFEEEVWHSPRNKTKLKPAQWIALHLLTGMKTPPSDFGVKTQGTLHCSFAHVFAFRFYIGCDLGALKWSSSLSEFHSNLQLHQLFIVTCGTGAMARLYILVN